MIILKSIDDLKNYIDKTFEGAIGEPKANEVATYIVTGLGDKGEIFGYARDSKSIVYNAEAFGEVCQAIFQLDDYKMVLKNYIEFLLAAEQFESVCNFLNKLFVTNVGTFKYRSVQKQYSLSERYFDRFVEIEKYCDLPDELVMPFFVSIIKADARSLCYAFKEPLKEYLKLYMQTAHEKFFDYVVKNKVYDCIDYLLEADTNKTLRHLIESYIDGSLDSSVNIKNYLTKYKQESFNLLEPYAKSSNEEISYKSINLLMMFKGEWGIDSFLDGIYESTESNKIQRLISRELEIDKFERFGSLDEYRAKVEESVECGQERLYGLRLKKYYEDYNLQDAYEQKSATFMMETFKVLSNEMLLKYMKDYFEFAEASTKVAISNIVFDMASKREKLNGSKWALRLVAAFGDAELLEKIYITIVNWLKTLKTSDAEYYLKCMAIYGRDEFIPTIKRLRLDKDIDAKKMRKIEKLLKVYSDCRAIPYSNVELMMVEDFGLDAEGTRVFDLGRRKLKVTLTSDLTVELSNAETNKVGRLSDKVEYQGINLKEYVKAIEKQVSTQSKRLYTMFLNHTYMSLEDFNALILGNNLTRIVAGNILWAKYKNDRVYETFRIRNGAIRHLSGSYVTDNDYMIAICHPLDVQDNLEQISKLCGKLLFDQLSFPYFEKASFGTNAIAIDKFNGMFVNANLFITRLEKLTYRINFLGKDLYYNTLAKANEELDMLTVVEFDRVKLNDEANYTTTISSIRFYKLSSMPRDGKNYLLSKGEPMPLIAIDDRVLSNEIALIVRAAENKNR